MRKRKLRGGKQDIAGSKDDDAPTKDWRVELTAASKALALRWVRAAREGLDGKSTFLFLLRLLFSSMLMRRVLLSIARTIGVCAFSLPYVAPCRCCRQPKQENSELVGRSSEKTYIPRWRACHLRTIGSLEQICAWKGRWVPTRRVKNHVAVDAGCCF